MISDYPMLLIRIALSNMTPKHKLEKSLTKIWGTNCLKRYSETQIYQKVN